MSPSISSCSRPPSLPLLLPAPRPAAPLLSFQGQAVHLLRCVPSEAILLCQHRGGEGAGGRGRGRGGAPVRERGVRPRAEESLAAAHVCSASPYAMLAATNSVSATFHPPDGGEWNVVVTCSSICMSRDAERSPSAREWQREWEWGNLTKPKECERPRGLLAPVFAVLDPEGTAESLLVFPQALLAAPAVPNAHGGTPLTNSRIPFPGYLRAAATTVTGAPPFSIEALSKVRGGEGGGR